MSVYSLDSLENEPLKIVKVGESFKLHDAVAQPTERNISEARKTVHEGGANETADKCQARGGRSPRNAMIARNAAKSSGIGKKEIRESRAFSSEPRIPPFAVPLGRRRKLAATATATATSQPPNPKSKQPTSYLQLYCRRFAKTGDGESIFSPAGLSQPQVDAGASRDESTPSELSFYGRLLLEPRPQRATDDGAPRGQDSRPEPRVSSARLDSVDAKRESLMRRRSYGNAASAVNRQRISSATNKNKVVARSCCSGDGKPLGPAEISGCGSKPERRGPPPVMDASRHGRAPQPGQPSLIQLRTRHLHEKGVIRQLLGPPALPGLSRGRCWEPRDRSGTECHG